MGLDGNGFSRTERQVAPRRGWADALALGIALLAMPLSAGAAQHALMRFPTLHGNTIVFSAAGSLWRVDRKGGTAQRLTTDSGLDLMPRFSPDGKEIAFTGGYDGNNDVYVMPAEGGPVRRLTFHSDVVPDAPMRWGPDNMVVTWTPDGKNIMFLSRRTTYNSWFGQLFLVPEAGGAATRFPVPRGGVTSFSPDGSKIAYNRIFRNFRTWKRYYGGLAQDIWIYDLGTHETRAGHRLEGDRHVPDVVRRHHLLRLRPRPGEAAQHLGVRPGEQALQAGDRFQGLRHRLAEPGRHRHRVRLRRRDVRARPAVREARESRGRRSQRRRPHPATLGGRQQDDPGVRHRAQRQARPVRGPRRDLHRSRRARQHPRPDPDVGRPRAGSRPGPPTAGRSPS